MLVLAVVLFIINFSNGQVTGNGPCPESKPLTNYNLPCSMGRWYGIGRIHDDGQKGQHCRWGDFMLDEAKDHFIEHYYAILGNNTEDDRIIKFELIAGSNVARYIVTGKTTVYDVLDTDYTRFKTVYSCVENNTTNTHQQRAYFLTRKQFPSRRTVRKAYNALRKVGLCRGDYQIDWVPQKHCPAQ